MPSNFKSVLTQSFPPKPTFTEKDVPDLRGKVYIVTGANAGVGKELAQLLYGLNATVYLLARSADKTSAAIAAIQRSRPRSAGRLVFLRLDLADLAAVRAAADAFLAREPRLHVLFNNAGVLSAAGDLVLTPQGHELHVGTNCLGTFLLTDLLTPVLARTARDESPGTVRVVWVCSSASEIFAEDGVGVRPEKLSPEAMGQVGGTQRYWTSKVGNWAHAAEYALRRRADGIVSVPVNPGNLRSELYRDSGWALWVGGKLFMYPPLMGAYTELFAGLSPMITLEKTGCWVVPFGRIYPIRSHMERATKVEAEGGTGGTLKLWEWTEEQVKSYR